MTTFEIISIIISIFSLLIAFGMLIIALLAYIDRKNKRK
ncbi:MAG: putative holin-like toxin [Lachnospiraceae bacterium]|nr:putative holin-like toxin [Lachnospiraceae bacterium]